jgi:aldehyde dehydrogenase (NAD+)
MMVAKLSISELLCKQRDFFQTGKTKPVDFRLQMLKNLKKTILEHKKAILKALAADLHKPVFESYITEIVTLKEIDYAIKNLRRWTKPRKVRVPLELFPYSGRIQAEPLGVVLIISPWNYPFHLLISPLVGAIAAGNCAVLKPSEFAPYTSGLIANLIEKTFEPAYIAVVEGGVETSQTLLAEKFDYIFFTGGNAVGKIVMAAAAKHLTPVTLELGGKSPCLVDTEIDVEKTARRICWGKFINAGQTCIAPDYLLVNKNIKNSLLDSIKKCLLEFYGEHPANSPDYARIIHQNHFDRLVKFLQDGEILIGGEINRDELYISPTVIDKVSWEAPIMQEEIFGPILPVIEYTDIAEAIAKINSRPKPLALYLFSDNKNLQQYVLQSTSSGGVCLNDTLIQSGVPSLPFGGVGDSGIGSYHGKASFDTFSHYKSVVQNSFWLDLKWRYPPYEGKLSFLKRLIG